MSELSLLIEELNGYHDMLDHGHPNGIRIYTHAETEQQRLNFRAVLREAASALKAKEEMLRGIHSQLVELQRDHQSALSSISRMKEVLAASREFIAGMIKPAAPGIMTITSYHPCHALVAQIDSALSSLNSVELQTPKFIEGAISDAYAAGYRPPGSPSVELQSNQSDATAAPETECSFRWKPMATAPRDANILVFDNSKGLAIVRCDRGFWHAQIDGHGIFNPIDEEPEYLLPTHWMPLPSPPNA